MPIIRNNNAYQAYLDHFIKEVKTICPQCNKMALVKAPGYPNKPFEAKLTCLHCGFNKSAGYDKGPLVTGNTMFGGQVIVTGRPMDPFFGSSLWYSQDCCGELLWAYNDAHLDLLEQHVSAKHRERTQGEDYINRSIGSRLPQWMTAASNRDAVLKAIQKLRQKK